VSYAQLCELHEQTRQMLSAVHNTLDLCNRPKKLPTEILQLIFRLVQPQNEDFLPSWPDRTSLDWLSVTQLHIAVDMSSELIDVCRYLNRPAPDLHSLSLCVRGIVGSFSYHDVMPTLFGGQCRAIKKLALASCPIWKSNTLENLTHLAFYGSSNRADLVDGLILRSPELQELILTDISLGQSCLTRERSPLSLPRLRTLQYKGRSGYISLHPAGGLKVPDGCTFWEEHLRSMTSADALAALKFHPSGRAHHIVRLILTQHNRIFVRAGEVSLMWPACDVDLLAGALKPVSKLVLVVKEHAPTSICWKELFAGMKRTRTLVVADQLQRTRWGDYPGSLDTLMDALGSGALPALESLQIYGATMALWPMLWVAMAKRVRAGASSLKTLEPMRPADKVAWAGNQCLSEEEKVKEDNYDDHYGSDY
ncbi:hypothetical protein HDZ31DRAFT_34604, partial [Schizophyllum fasciatum]